MATKATNRYAMHSESSDGSKVSRLRPDNIGRPAAFEAERADGGMGATESPGRIGRLMENGSIYESIREGILTGRYAPGERLIEARLAEEFDVSRTRIRDALARLHTDH